MAELMKGACRSLWRKRHRHVLTAMAIAIGVMLVSVVSVIGEVGNDVMSRELDSMGVGGLSVLAVTGGELISEDTLDELRELSCVRSAMPLMLQLGTASTAAYGSETALCGIDAGADQVISLNLLYGRLISPGDVSAAARVCVLDESLAQALFRRSNVVGKTVTVQYGNGAEQLMVVGVTETGSSLLQNFTSLIPGMMYLPYTTHGVVTGQAAFDQVAIRVTGSTEAAQRRVERLLERLYGGTSPFRTDDLAVQKERLEGLLSLVTLILTVISAISLLVSGFGIVTAMLSSVSERTREIGIKKAIGATGRRILWEFLTEALLLSAAGALLGMIPAAIAVGVVQLLGLSVRVPIAMFVRLFAFSLAVGGLFGAYPAYKASRLPPVQALRSE